VREKHSLKDLAHSLRIRERHQLGLFWVERWWAQPDAQELGLEQIMVGKSRSELASLNRELAALGQEIRRLRQQRNITQGQLAFRCGLHRSYLTDVERGTRNLTLSSLLVIARGLEVTISKLTRAIDAPVRQRLGTKKRGWRC